MRLPSLQAIGALLLYLWCGPWLILLNRRLLRVLGFPYPIALSALGAVFSALSSQLLVRRRLVSPLPPASRRLAGQHALPLAFSSALTLALGNAAYVHLSVGACQILKTLTPALTLLLLWLLRVEAPAAREGVLVALIALGTAVASRGEVALAPLGLLLQLGANLSEALRVVLSQRLIAGLPLVQMQYYVAPLQAACLLIASFALELRDPSDRAKATACLFAHPLHFFLAGSLGLVQQAATLLVVREFGSVAVKLLGQARNAALVLFEVSRGNQRASVEQLAGYSLSLLFFTLYVRERQSPARATRPHGKEKEG
ncbi:hypothetical protein AB1Y20_020706 [Prymnesium parvum]